MQRCRLQRRFSLILSSSSVETGTCAATEAPFAYQPLASTTLYVSSELAICECGRRSQEGSCQTSPAEGNWCRFLFIWLGASNPLCGSLASCEDRR